MELFKQLNLPRLPYQLWSPCDQIADLLEYTIIKVCHGMLIN